MMTLNFYRHHCSPHEKAYVCYTALCYALTLQTEVQRRKAYWEGHASQA